jgi:hypothetical protein
LDSGLPSVSIVNLVITSGCVFLVGHLLFAFLPVADKSYIGVIPLVLLGISYSIYVSSLWPSIPYVVPPRTVGTAFGLTTAIQNVGMTVFP